MALVGDGATALLLVSRVVFTRKIGPSAVLSKGFERKEVVQGWFQRECYSWSKRSQTSAEAREVGSHDFLEWRRAGGF
jgi:hypothetical protein